MYILKAAWNLTGFWMCKPTEQTNTQSCPGPGVGPGGGHGREGVLSYL